MKKSLLTLAVLSLILSSCGGGEKKSESQEESESTPISETSEDNAKEINVSFNDALISDFEIDPHIYGGFLEMFSSYVYSSVWSELIMDRKFLTPVGEDVSRWVATAGTPQGETANPYQGKYSPILPANTEIKNTSQIALLEKEYTGYLWAKGSGALEIRLEGSKTLSTSININAGDYTKYSFTFNSNMDHEYANLFVKSTSGTITFDSISLMPGDNVMGMRKDIVDKFKDDVNITYLRFPGGNMVSGYDWRGGIGDRDKREYFHDDAWNTPHEKFATDEERLAYELDILSKRNFYSMYNPNDFGIDDYMNLCQYIGAEPNVIVNSGNGDKEMAAQEVEYCNGAYTSEWGSKRPREEPYDVRLWGIGNEMQGDWQIGHVSIAEYAERHNEFAAAMRAVDPTIKLIACGENNSGWSQSMIDRCGTANIDYLSEHFYCKQEKRSDDSLRLYIIKMSDDQFRLRIERHRELTGRGKITMAVDEFAYEGLSKAARMRDAYMVASSYNTCHRNGDVVTMTAYSFFVGHGGFVNFDPFESFTEGVGYTVSLYSRNALDYYIPLEYKGGQSAKDYYELSATVNKEGTKMTVSVINTNAFPLRIKSSQFKSVDKIDYIVGGDELSYNDAEVGINITRHTEELNQDYILVKPHSISMVSVSI